MKKITQKKNELLSDVREAVDVNLSKLEVVKREPVKLFLLFWKILILLFLFCCCYERCGSGSVLLVFCVVKGTGVVFSSSVELYPSFYTTTTLATPLQQHHNHQNTPPTFYPFSVPPPTCDSAQQKWEQIGSSWDSTKRASQSTT